MADEIITGGRTFNFLPYNATTNPYGLGGDGHNTIAPGETINNLFLLFDSVRQDVLASSNTSLSSNTVGTGSKTFTVVSNYNYLTDSNIKIVDAANSANVMYGTVSSYNSSTLQLATTITSFTGSGTISSWKIMPSGATGATGTAGTNGTNGNDGEDGTLSGNASGNIDMLDFHFQKAEFKDYSETCAPVTATTTTTINIEDGNVINLTHGADITTFTWSNPSATGKACSFTLVRTKDNSATVRTIAWPAAVKWSEATPPDLTQTAEAVDIFTFMTLNAGATWYGFHAGVDMG